MNKPAKKRSKIFWLMCYCIFVFTAGQFIPIYFIDSNLKTYYYIVMLVLLCGSISASIYLRYHNPRRYNILAFISSVVVGVGLFSILGMGMILAGIGEWTVAGTYFIKKSNPDIRIVSRYMDQGALGGGTHPEDYTTCITRPITPLFTLETSVDTNTIDKSEWIKSPAFKKLHEP
jgi:hypothetical protein